MACLAGSRSYPEAMAIRVPRPFRTPLTEADFSYTVSEDVLKIVDLDLGGNSVTNDAERVLGKIEQWQPGLIARCRIMYRDSRGNWDGIEWDGEGVTFFPIRETDERAAERKLRQLEASAE
jgi:hypothetical protein